MKTPNSELIDVFFFFTVCTSGIFRLLQLCSFFYTAVLCSIAVPYKTSSFVFVFSLLSLYSRSMREVIYTGHHAATINRRMECIYRARWFSGFIPPSALVKMTLYTTARKSTIPERKRKKPGSNKLKVKDFFFDKMVFVFVVAHSGQFISLKKTILLMTNGK